MEKLETRRAMLLIVLIIILSDGETDRSELDMATRYFRDNGIYTDEELAQEIALLLHLLDDPEFELSSALNYAASSLPENLKKTTYSIATNCCFVDGNKLRGDYVMALSTLALELEITSEDSKNIINVLSILHDKP